MKRYIPILLFIFFTAPVVSVAQQPMPGYKDVLLKFSREYAVPSEPLTRLGFAKKKDGWHVYYRESFAGPVTKNELFWSLQKGVYVPLDSFRQRLSANAVNDSWIPILVKEHGYNFARCPYFGYKGWEEDVIKEYGDPLPLKDTLLEGLGRAYQSLSGHYVWGIMADSLAPGTNSIPFPVQSRIDKLKHASVKEIEINQELLRRNPGYKTFSGSISSTLFMGQMSYYFNLRWLELDEEASKLLEQIKAPAPIRQAGYNFLNACAPNSILFVENIFELFPALYVQVKEAFRGDVAVVVPELFYYPPYLQWIQKNRSPAFETQPRIYGSRSWLFMSRTTSGDFFSPVSLFMKDFFDIVEKREYSLSTENGLTILGYPGDRLNLPVDINQFKKIYKPPVESSIQWRLPVSMTISDYIVFDMINTNFHQRPIYFSRKKELYNDIFNLNDEAYLYRLANRDYKYRPSFDFAKHDIKILENYLNTVYKPVLNHPDSAFQFANANLDESHIDMFYRITQYYLGPNDMTNARSWCKRFLATLKGGRMRYTANLSGMSISLMRSGFNKEGIELLEKAGEDLVEYQRKNGKPWPGLENPTAGILKEYLSLLTNRKLDSKKLRSLIEDAQLLKSP
jgi:hypothetical protein